MQIGDLFFGLRADGARLQQDVAKAGDKAGETFGDHMSSAFQRGKFGASIVQGFGIGVGVAAFHAMTDAIGDVVSAIPDLIGRGLEFSNLVDELGDATGASAEEASRLIGTYQLLGVSTANLGTRMGLLARVVVANEAAVNKFGIATRDVDGHLLNQVQIVENARQMLSKYESGTAKAAIMVKLFGRAGLDMADYLSLSDEQVRLITGDLEQMGVILGSKAAEEAEAAKIEMRRFDLSLQGLANTLLSNILPALVPAISGVTDVVRDNAKQIGQFLAQVVNFVLGVVAALTGADIGATSFTASLGEVGGAADQASSGLDGVADKTDKSASASKAAVAAYDKQIKHLDRMTASVEKLDGAQDKQFHKELDRITGVVDAQLDAMDAAERQLALNEQLNDAQLALASAQRPGMGGEVDAQGVSDAMARVAELQRQQSEDLRKGELGGVKDFIEGIADSESEWASKKGFLEQLKKNEVILNSDLARAHEEGNLQEVADLSLKLEAVTAAARRTQQAAANQDQTQALTDQKARLSDLQQAARDSGASVGTGIAAGAVVGTKAIGEMTLLGEANMRRLGSSVNGDGGLVEAMNEAREAGMKFGSDIKDAFKAAGDALGVVLDGLHWIVENIDMIGLAFRYLTNDAFRQEVTAAAQQQGNPLGFVPSAIGQSPVGPALGGAGTVLDWLLHLGGRAAGGPAEQGVPYIVGERRPELFVPSERGSIVPSLDAMRGWMGGFQTIEVPVYLDGAVITRVVSRRQADERNH